IHNISVKKFIPNYTYHVDENIVYLKSGKLITTFVIDGFPFEATDDNQVQKSPPILLSFLPLIRLT
ncbi:MAG TPA: hypothetical protein ACHBZ9_16645, partial [Arsenophonus nasoniae]|uniref:hypothetical protein n=1 Tax=Arsenophonus nasoniae TaxID=638 RepID=UPI0038796323